jgi:alginate O-acetyltransferase complex protein AlgI
VLFNSITFLIFFALVLALDRVLPWPRARKVWLLFASYVFYAAWNPSYVLILWCSTVLDWALARLIFRSTDERRRKMWLLVSLTSNLGMLAFFKYADFLAASAESLLALLGVVYHAPHWDIVLPIGISFYTFASLSYTIDVYRREIHADWKLLDYALFVAFFPHLVAGPIVRAARLLPQIARPRKAHRDELGWGLTLSIIGLFCKTVLADGVFAPVANEVFATPAQFGALDAWAAVLAFSAQIYFDFAGYSLCAIGLALCFGFSFPDNFRFPYAAAGFADFWRRWHISLSSWLRDYLYIPLGGNRGSATRTYFNLVLTMLLGGLWHGASWTFVLWGGLHGVYLALERWCRTHVSLRVPQLVAIGATCLVVTLTWIPFRAADASAALGVARGLFRFGTAPVLSPERLALCYLTFAAMLRWQYRLRGSSLEANFLALGRIAQVTILAACLFAMFLYSGGDEHAFIYFQF